MSKVSQVIVVGMAMCIIAIFIAKQAADNHNQNMRIETLQYQVQQTQAPDPCYDGESLEHCVNRTVK
jgi:hypothetical protein